jgi:hypothetical protein
MVWKKVPVGDTGTSTVFGGDDLNKISDYFSGTADVDKVDINSDTTFRSSRVKLRNPANTFSTTLVNSAIAANRNLTVPLLTGNDTLATEAHTQTLTNKTLTALVQSSYEDFMRISTPADPGADIGRLYVKQIDSNNDGLFIKVKKAGAYVEVQIA